MSAALERRVERLEEMVAQLITSLAHFRRDVKESFVAVNEAFVDVSKSFVQVNAKLAAQSEALQAARDELRGEMHAIRDDIRADVRRMENRMEFAWRECIYQRGELALRVNRLEEEVFQCREGGPESPEKDPKS